MVYERGGRVWTSYLLQHMPWVFPYAEKGNNGAAKWYIYGIKKDVSTIIVTKTCSKNKIVKLKYKY